MVKGVIKIVKSVATNEGVGGKVRRSIGSAHLKNLDPFLLLDEMETQKPGGFPDHPHRGFETVTYMLEGVFQHEDFAGHKGKIGPGDVQWMTAGRGIIHAEMPLSNGICRGLQLWINLSGKNKMMEPRYQELTNENIPIVKQGGITAKVIAGECFGVAAKIYTKSPIYYLDIKMENNQTFLHKIPANYTCFVYTLFGKVIIDSTEIDDHNTVVLGGNDDSIEIKTDSSRAHFVLIAGEPLHEPVVQYGPFVMNTKQEIEQTLNDFNNGKNGFEKRGWRSTIGN
jgi:redox-sensitive bicupin YhaK (pirin superfamily)